MAITVEQHITKLNAQLEELRRENIPLFMGSTEGVRLLVDRVFEQGRNSQNGSIALKKKFPDTTPPTQYSRKPIYVNPLNSPRSFPKEGKTGESTFKNGNPHKTRYFEGGYADFRNTIGRDMMRINLKLTGDLHSNVANLGQPSGGKRISENKITPVKVSVDTYVISLRPNNTKKWKGLEKRSSAKIFKHTKQELEAIKKTTEFELFKLLNT